MTNQEKAINAIKKLQADNKKLKEYAAHLCECAKNPDNKKECTCGLDKLL